MTSSSLNTGENTPTRSKSERGPFVATMIAIAALLFLATEALLYYRWATMTEPTCILVVETGESLRGAEVTVSGVTIEPYKVTVGAGGRFALPFYLEPGDYSLKVEQNDQTLVEPTPFTMVRNTMQKVDLTKLKGMLTTVPATLPQTFP